jgi:hypothetical protein
LRGNEKDWADIIKNEEYRGGAGHWKPANLTEKIIAAGETFSEFLRL